MRKLIHNMAHSHGGTVLTLLVAISGWLTGLSSVNASTISLTPLSSDVFLNGDGANSTWVQVRNDWHGPSEFSQLYGGISTLADAHTAIGLAAGDPAILRSATARMDNINAGNDVYNQDYASSWGATNTPPLFNTGDPQQENFVGHVWGFIAVPKTGEYNFGVLFDDGFTFTLNGLNSSLSMSVDGLNPRDRKGFDSNLSLTKGMYSYDLLGYNRLEAGVLSLGWWQPISGGNEGGGNPQDNFETIPQSNLFTELPVDPTVVPLPSAVWLFGSGILGMLSLARRRLS